MPPESFLSSQTVPRPRWKLDPLQHVHKHLLEPAPVVTASGRRDWPHCLVLPGSLSIFTTGSLFTGSRCATAWLFSF